MDSDLEEGEYVDTDLPGPVSRHIYFSSDHESPSSTGHDQRQIVAHTTSSTAKTPRSGRSTPDKVNGIYSEIYGDARPAVELKAGARVNLSDIQGLVLWILGQHLRPQWVFIKHKPLITKVVLLLANGLSESLYNAHQEHFVHLQQLGQPVMVPALHQCSKPAQAAAALLQVPGQPSESRKRSFSSMSDALGAVNVSPHNGAGPLPASAYVLTESQLRANAFPLHEITEDGQTRLPDGYRAAEAQEGGEAMVALDCEMVGVAGGLALARCSLVSACGGVLLDELVRVEEDVTDYLTQWSGITQHMLAGATTTLAQVQSRVLSHMSQSTLLVGHALDNDLKALRLVHRRVLDTSIMFGHPRGPPFRPALRVLAARHLKITIQGAAHDSVQDARAALALAQLKIRKGPQFGLPSKGGCTVTPLVELLALNGRRCCLVDTPRALQRAVSGSADLLPVDDDAACAAQLGQAALRGATVQQCSSNATVQQYHFLWGQLHGLVELYRARCQRKRQLSAAEAAARAQLPVVARGEALGTPATEAAVEASPTAAAAAAASTTALAGPTSPPPCHYTPKSERSVLGEEEKVAGSRRRRGALALSPDSFASLEMQGNGLGGGGLAVLCAAKAVDSHIGAVWRCLPAGTLLLVATGQGDTEECQRLQEQKHRRQQGLDGAVWTGDEEQHFLAVVKANTAALCWAAIKPEVHE